MFLTLGYRFPQIVGPCCKIELEGRQMWQLFTWDGWLCCVLWLWYAIFSVKCSIKSLGNVLCIQLNMNLAISNSDIEFNINMFWKVWALYSLWLNQPYSLKFINVHLKKPNIPLQNKRIHKIFMKGEPWITTGLLISSRTKYELFYIKLKNLITRKYKQYINK